MIARGFSLFAISVSASFVSGMSGVVIGRWVRSSGMGGQVAVGVGVAALASVVLAWLVGRFGDRHPVPVLVFVSVLVAGRVSARGVLLHCRGHVDGLFGMD